MINLGDNSNLNMLNVVWRAHQNSDTIELAIIGSLKWFYIPFCAEIND